MQFIKIAFIMFEKKKKWFEMLIVGNLCGARAENMFVHVQEYVDNCRLHSIEESTNLGWKNKRESIRMINAIVNISIIFHSIPDCL